MWLALGGVCWVVAMIWVATLILVVRGRVQGYKPPTTVGLGSPAASPPPIPPWMRPFIALLGAVVRPSVMLLLFVLLAPFTIASFAIETFYWFRLKLFGIPMPEHWPPEDPTGDA